MEYKGEGFISGLATLGKGVPRVGYVGAGCTQGRVWLGEWLGWFVTLTMMWQPDNKQQMLFIIILYSRMLR